LVLSPPFAELLRQRLHLATSSPVVTVGRRIASRASQWYEDHGLISSLQHAGAAGVERAERLIDGAPRTFVAWSPY
jgi:hypothetical protein